MSSKVQEVSAAQISGPSEAEPAWPASWQVLDQGIRVGRYIDPNLLRLEYQRLWRKVWQVAARIDEIAELNDFTTYEIGDQSVFLVRVDEDTVRAYVNACPHRGTALTQGAGTFENGNIICPFHGWRWNMQCDNKYILARDEFRDGQLCNADVALKSLNCVVIAGFVFINFDRDRMPLDEYIAPIRHLLEDLNVGRMRHYW